MLAIHFNHTRQLLVTEQKEKGISYSEYLPFFFKKKRSLIEKLFPFAWAALFLSRCLRLSAAKRRTMWFIDFLIEIVHSQIIGLLLPWKSVAKFPLTSTEADLVYQWVGKNTTSAWVIQKRTIWMGHLGHHALVCVLCLVPYITGSCMAAGLVASSASFGSLLLWLTDFIVNLWCLA